MIRDGEQQIIDSDDLVPGDLAVLDEGDAVPADIRLIEVAQLEVVESILTGESLPVTKKTDAIKAKVIIIHKEKKRRVIYTLLYFDLYYINIIIL